MDEPQKQIFLFINDRCNFSERLIGLIEKYWAHNDVNIVNISDLKKEQKPEYITETPTLLVLTEPDTTELFPGQKAFDWLYDKVIDIYSSANCNISGLKIKSDETTETAETAETNETQQILFKSEGEFSNDTDVKKACEERMKEYGM